MTSPDLTTFCGLDELGLQVVGQQIRPGHAVLACRVAEPDQWCRRCGCEGVPRDSVVRPLAHEPLGWRPTTLLVTVCRYRCTGCGHVWRQDLSKAAEPRAKLTRCALRWALQAIVCQHLTVARVAEGLAVAWNTANDAVLAEGKRVLFSDPARLDGVRVLGVDEHVWRHTRKGDKYVTVIIDLTPIRDGTGPSRLLDMVEGRSKQAFKTWLSERPQAWRDAVEVVAMDGFTGFKTATSEELPEAVAVMDPFHVVRLAGDALDQCRRRVQQDTYGHRGRTGDPLYASRRTLHTGAALLIDKQKSRLEALFAVDEHAAVEVTWSIYQKMIGAYRDPDRSRGEKVLTKLTTHSRAVSPPRCPSSSRLAGPRTAGPPTCSPTSTGPAPATAPPKPSTADSSTCATAPSASATSPTTSPGACSRRGASEPNYTVICEEPLNDRPRKRLFFRKPVEEIGELCCVDRQDPPFGYWETALEPGAAS